MSRQARELLILLLVVMKVVLLVIMMILAVVEIMMVILLNFRKFWTDFGAGNDFLGVALVESIDKRWMFGIDTMFNR